MIPSSLTPPLQGREIVTRAKNTNRNLSTVHPQGDPRLWTSQLRSIHRVGHLSTEPVDKCSTLWINCPVVGRWGAGRLWINLWIRGVQPVDKPVDISVDNPNLWITRELSTTRPQVGASYPQFCPQPRGEVFGLGKVDFATYPHIHSPYYYYYSNT